MKEYFLPDPPSNKNSLHERVMESTRRLNEREERNNAIILGGLGLFGLGSLLGLIGKLLDRRENKSESQGVPFEKRKFKAWPWDYR